MKISQVSLSIQQHGRVIILLQKELINHEATEGYLTRNTRTRFLYKELGSLINNQDISRKENDNSEDKILSIISSLKNYKITHLIIHAELKGLKQKGGESLRNYYRRFGELRAQVHDITQREVIEAFSHGIMARWQFQDFCKENPRNNEEFRRTVEKMITTEEKTRERFLDRNN